MHSNVTPLGYLLLIIKETVQGKNQTPNCKSTSKEDLSKTLNTELQDGPIGTSYRQRKETLNISSFGQILRATNQYSYANTTVIATLDESDLIHHNGHRYVGRIS